MQNIQYFLSKNKLIFFLIIIFSAFLRFIYFFYFTDYYALPIEDAKGYHSMAIKILQNGFFNIDLHTRPILFPALLSFVYKLSPQNDLFIYGRIFNILLSSVSIGIFYFILLKSNFSNFSSSLFSFLMSIYPPSIFYSVLLLTENLAILLLLILTYYLLLLSTDKNNSIYNSISIGVLFGLLTLTRSSFLLLPIFLIISVIFINLLMKKNLLPLRSLIIIILLYLITLTPWTLKNYYEHDMVMPTTSRLGYGLYLCNNDFSNQIILQGGYSRTQVFESNLEIANALPLKKRSSFLISKSLEEISNNKLEFIYALNNRFINLMNFRPNPYKENYSKNDYIMLIIWMPILVIFLLSIFRRLEKIEYIYLLLITYVLLFHLPFWGLPRFRYPVDPIFMLIAFKTLYVWLIKLKKLKYNRIY